MAKYKLSSMRWEFGIRKVYNPDRWYITFNKPIYGTSVDKSLPLTKTIKEAEKAIHSFCRVNGIKSYGITE